MASFNSRDLLSRRISIGVTGFSRSGKTVFIGALAHALLSADAWKGRRGQGPLAGFGPFERGEFSSAQIRDDLHGDEPQFSFRKVRDALCDDVAWPAPTEGLSRLVLEVVSEPKPKSGWSKGRGLGLEELGRGKLLIELIDYPGEWLIDLPMLKLDYSAWSEDLLTRAAQGTRRQLSMEFSQLLESMPPPVKFDEDIAIQLTEAWTAYLERAAAMGLVFNQPGRLLRPDQLAHSPVLRLVPLPASWAESRFYAGMQRRFNQYKKLVIKPFYRNHFAKIDRQLVMIDVLRALQHGEEAFRDMQGALGATLKSFAYGKGGLISRLTGSRITHILFAVPKADHVIRGDRANLEKLLERLIRRLDDYNRVRASVRHHSFSALASIRATQDHMRASPPHREILFGRRKGHEEPKSWDPGGVPLDFPPDWQNLRFQFLNFEPAHPQQAREEGLPAIKLGKALDFLIGEDLS